MLDFLFPYPSYLAIILVWVIHWYGSMFMHTFFLHRYASHSQFTMSKSWEKFFFIVNWFFQGSTYLSPTAYAKMHRLHHAHTDTQEDPHSPKHIQNPLKLMLATRDYYNKMWEDDIEDKFMKNLPVWEGFDKWAGRMPIKLLWGAGITIFYLIFAPSPWLLLLLPLHWYLPAIHGFLVNWGTHKIGYRNNKTTDTSTNFLPVEFLLMGEWLHNNHHARPASSNFAQRFFEFDPTYPILKVMNFMGIIQLKTSAIN